MGQINNTLVYILVKDIPPATNRPHPVFHTKGQGARYMMLGYREVDYLVRLHQWNKNRSDIQTVAIELHPFHK